MAPKGTYQVRGTINYCSLKLLGSILKDNGQRSIKHAWHDSICRGEPFFWWMCAVLSITEIILYVRVHESGHTTTAVYNTQHCTHP